MEIVIDKKGKIGQLTSTTQPVDAGKSCSLLAKMSENEEIYSAAQKFYTAAGSDGSDKSHLCQPLYFISYTYIIYCCLLMSHCIVSLYVFLKQLLVHHPYD